jgi:hypothetical protein
MSKSNSQFVVELMENSPSGIVAEVFVIEAIRFYSDIISKSSIENTDKTPVINPRAWKEVAEEFKEKLKKRFEG